MNLNYNLIKLLGLESEFMEAQELNLNDLHISTDKRINFKNESSVFTGNHVNKPEFINFILLSNDLLELEAKEKNKDFIIFSKNKDNFYNLVAFSDKQIDKGTNNDFIQTDLILEDNN
jgi:hypothetical protein